MSVFIPITNTPRDYAWGKTDGVSQALGWAPSGGPEAELWLGSHPLSPSRPADRAREGWADLSAWERDAAAPLPYLMKVLSAASNLSLQAHPSAAQAREGYAREEAAGIPLTAPERNYKDPHAKPEVIVAVDDGFEALCGFRTVAETVAALDRLGVDHPALAHWRVLLTAPDGVRAAFLWLLSGAQEVADLVAAVTDAAADGDLVSRLADGYPGDPGILVALMMNRVVLRAGEALWLPAGNIHAYLRGTGIELMGPSDNVLRGGLTPKHVDRDELERALDFTPAAPPHLQPVSVGANVVSYRPWAMPSGADVGFELLLVTGDAAVRTGSAAIALAVDGAFALTSGAESADIARGGILFLPEPAEVTVTGSGRLFVATGR